MCNTPKLKVIEDPSLRIFRSQKKYFNKYSEELAIGEDVLY